MAERVLRFHPALRHPAGGTWPAMVGLFTDLRTDEPRGIHRTFLASDGNGKAPVGGGREKLMLGRSGGAAVKLDADDNVELGLVIGEGIETCLAARHARLPPVLGAGLGRRDRAACRSCPASRRLTILGETDDGGANARAAKDCAQRWLAAGRRLVVEPLVGGDANDVLEGGRDDGGRFRERRFTRADFEAAPEFSDEALALDFAARHRAPAALRRAMVALVHLDGHRWEQDDTLLAFDLAREVCRDAAAICNSNSASAKARSAPRRP